MPLVTVAALLLGRPALGGVLAGLMPWVHLGQAPPVFLFAGLGVAWSHWRGERTVRNRLAAGLLAGLAVTAVAWGAHRTGTPYVDATIPTEPLGTEHEVWSSWIAQHDMHRQPPPENGHLITWAFLGLAGGWMASRERRRADGLGVVEAAAAYAALIVAIVYGILAVQLLVGTNVPPILYTWMPYRLANQLPILVVALVVSVLIQDSGSARIRTASRIGLLSVLGFVLVRIPLAGTANMQGLMGYLTVFEAPFYGLLGMALGRLAVHTDSRRRVVYGVAIGLVLGTGFVHLFGAVCLIAGWSGFALIHAWPGADRMRPHIPRSATGIAVILFAVATIVQHALGPDRPLEAGVFERNVAQTLAAVEQPNAMLLAPPAQITLQAQTGHPVMTDLATPYNGISYRPHLAPLINGMYRDLFGMDLRTRGADDLWKRIWSERTPQEWQSLAERYRFEYVVAPNDVEVQLPLWIGGETRSLYGLGDLGNHTGNSRASQR